MTKKFTDKWGDEREAVDQKDWSRWPLWGNYEAAYQGEEDPDFIEQDVIVWRESIVVNRNARSPDKPADWVRTGERLVIAHVRGFEGQAADWVYLVVIHSDGDEPLVRDRKIKRRKNNILRNGVRRWPRGEMASVSRPIAELGRVPDTPLNVRRASSPTPTRQSRFLGSAGRHNRSESAQYPRS